MGQGFRLYHHFSATIAMIVVRDFCPNDRQASVVLKPRISSRLFEKAGGFPFTIELFLAFDERDGRVSISGAPDVPSGAKTLSLTYSTNGETAFLPCSKI